MYGACRYAAGRFDLDNAIGPLRLDLGDVLYAPNVMRDDKGRVLLWGWLQERRTVSIHSMAVSKPSRYLRNMLAQCLHLSCSGIMCIEALLEC